MLSINRLSIFFIVLNLLQLSHFALTENFANFKFSQIQQSREKSRFLASKAKEGSSSSGILSSSTSSSQSIQITKCQANILRIKNQTSFGWSSIANQQTAFTDSLFPANQDSIYQKSSYIGSKYDKLNSQISWQRARSKLTNATIFNNDLITKSSKSLPTDIDASIVDKDLYFLASLSALQDSQIQNIIQTSTYNKAGIFAANVYIKGIKTSVIVDDYLPFINNKLAFAQQSGTAIWGPLMEKIWAKTTGNYDATTSNFQNGNPNEAFDFLLGLPTEYYRISYYYYYYNDYSMSYEQDYDQNAEDTIDQRLKLAENFIPSQNYANISYFDSSIETYIKQCIDNGFNLVSSITYYNYQTYSYETKYVSILGIYDIQSQYGGYISDTILLMYNQNGTDLQFYSWADNQTYYWTPNVLAQVPFYMNNQNDGLFYVSINDFRYRFTSLYVAHNHNGFKQSYLEILNDSGSAKMFTLQVTTPGTYYLGVQYYDPRMYPQGCRNGSTTGQFSIYTQNAVKLTQQYTSDYVGFNYAQFHYLVAGTYYLIAQTQYQQYDVNDFTVRAYGVDNVTIVQTNNATQATFIQSMIQALINNQAQFDGYLEYNDETLFQLIKGTNGVISYFQIQNNYAQSLSLTFNFYIGSATSIISSANGPCGKPISTKFGNVVQCTCTLQPQVYYYSYSYSRSSTSYYPTQNTTQSSCAFGWASNSTIYSFSYNY